MLISSFFLFIFINNLSIFKIKHIMTDKKKISVALSPEILNQLEEGKYNKSKLIDSLLSEHFNKENIKIVNK
jgi:hypothetical protein